MKEGLDPVEGLISVQSRLIAAAILMFFLFAACEEREEPQAPAPTPSPTAAELAQSCTAESGGFTIRYPADWFAEDMEGDACRFFHPEPFEVPEATESTGIAIMLRFSPAPLEDLRARIEGSSAERVEESQETTIAGMKAAQLLLESTGEALLPEGTLVYQYLVDVHGRTLIASTSSVASAGTFDSNQAVLDRMMQSLTVSPMAACSASEAKTDLAAQPSLPEEVTRTREAIFEAAAACDFDALEPLTTGGDQPFTYSFGEGGNPIRYWKRQERQGDGPLRFMVELLQRPSGTIEVQGGTQFVWPSAFAYESWQQVPKKDREALKPLYDEEDFEDFARFGGYIGYRVGISDSGEWLFFVAGD